MSTRETPWCWTCGTQATPSTTHRHRADNPVLAHDRCAECFDVLLTRPQPDVPEKVNQLAAKLSDAYLWTQVATTAPPSDDDEAALSEITELLTQARTLLYQRLGRHALPR